jgi:hypothetical protein
VRIASLALALVLTAAVPVRAQFTEELDPKGPKLDRTSTIKVNVGVTIKATGGPCLGIYATLPVPIDWPEQQVKIVSEDISPAVKSVSYRIVSGTVKQMVIEIPQLPAGEEAKVLVTLEVFRRTLLPPADTSLYSIPKKLDRQMMQYLAPSPYIESTDHQIVNYAKQVVAEKSTAWEKAEAIYDWVRNRVEYKNGDLKGARRALIDKTGDCEELSSLFIAMCRANKIPARTVWVPEHCYPEFYLVDDEGKGHWFPCQAAGTRNFGGIPEVRPILQKGDNFKDPDRPRERQRYMSEFLKGAGGGGKPQVHFIRDMVGS